MKKELELTCNYCRMKKPREAFTLVLLMMKVCTACAEAAHKAGMHKKFFGEKTLQGIEKIVKRNKAKK